MEINLLVLSVGNSRLAMGALVGGELQHVTRTPLDQRTNWAGRVAELWQRVAGKENAAVAGASVNPAVLEPLEHAIQQATGQKVEWVGREIDLPIKVLT